MACIFHLFPKYTKRKTRNLTQTVIIFRMIAIVIYDCLKFFFFLFSRTPITTTTKKKFKLVNGYHQKSLFLVSNSYDKPTIIVRTHATHAYT